MINSVKLTIKNQNNRVMKIALAQIKPIKGDIATNIVTHTKMVNLAVSYKADSIFFPELSITGYEPELARVLATNQDDTLFDDFQEMSNSKSITIGIGVPTNSAAGIQISMIIFQPNIARKTYSKQQLHADEYPFFIPGEKQIILTVNNKKIAPAICYESLQSNHSENAYKLGAEVYIASVAKSQNGVDKAMNHYPSIAKKYSMPVILCNCIGHFDNFFSVGQSAVWTKQGNLVAKLDDSHEGLLVFDTETEEVIQQKM